VPPRDPTRVVVADANALINLIHAGRLSLLGALAEYEFVVPENVVGEITNPAQYQALQTALAAGNLREEAITDSRELALYGELRQVMGRGEAACLALAESRGWFLASSDEKRRFRRETDARLGPGRVVTTPGLLILGIRAGALTVDEADQAKSTLARHRFRMPFGSFRDVLGGS
jgi:predicted nucleic acid-binding protein